MLFVNKLGVCILLKRVLGKVRRMQLFHVNSDVWNLTFLESLCKYVQQIYLKIEMQFKTELRNFYLVKTLQGNYKQ